MPVQSGMADAIRQLGHALGLGDAVLDANGACAMQFDERYIVTIQCDEAEDALCFHADLGDLPRPQTCVDLLRANLFWQGTGGATLALSHDDPPRVILARSVAWRGAGTAALLEVLETFVNTVEEWTLTFEEQSITA